MVSGTTENISTAPNNHNHPIAKSVLQTEWKGLPEKSASSQLFGNLVQTQLLPTQHHIPIGLEFDQIDINSCSSKQYTAKSCYQCSDSHTNTQSDCNILSAHENLASRVRAFLRIAALETLAVE
jgi:hypothetical protein